ncbi:hypothetical protein [Prochlorococcus sp. MIT 0718]|uniref:hypothetical protein n=1 Tax=Prochlorococcus sp. MIT 0718 TaxID=3082539 RepID=UPI000533A502|nr:hypothetical protein EV12_0254 [Prochlorococcus sp. MIT 0701]KGG34500.1 hypothetical protein EV14_1182 [Prochlorococcus sp. MIT 0703]
MHHLFWACVRKKVMACARLAHKLVAQPSRNQSGRQDSNLRPSAPKGTGIVSWGSDQVLKTQLCSGSCLQVLAGGIN